VVEVAWGIVANHGGGYSYRLCKVPEDGLGYITEDCFQQTPLDFVGDTQWVQFGLNSSKRVALQAMRTTNITHPAGSMWTRNPIPACDGPMGGDGTSTGAGVSDKCDHGFQFSPPVNNLTLDTLAGHGNRWRDGKQGMFGWSIVDKVQVPELVPGKYVLSFRWDCEQTPQVWASCANVEIVAPFAVV
jgi:hypothetical protein